MKNSTVFEKSIAVNNNRSIRISYIMLNTGKMVSFCLHYIQRLFSSQIIDLTLILPIGIEMSSMKSKIMEAVLDSNENKF